MKSILYPIVWFFICITINGYAQQNPIPNVELLTLEGKSIRASSIIIPDQPLLLIFFKTYDRKACENLFSLHDVFYEKLYDKGVRLVAICLDQNGVINYLKPFVNGHGLEIDVYIDPNGELRRSMGINDPAYTILFDNQMKEYCRHAGYCPSGDELMCEKVYECLNKLE